MGILTEDMRPVPGRPFVWPAAPQPVVVDSLHSRYGGTSLPSRSSGGSAVTGRMFWPAIAVLVIGLFMLVAGIGPLWLPILVVLLGAVAAVMSRRSLRQDRRS